MKKMPASEFKVHCLAVMDEVQAKRETVLITKRGKPVAKLVPVEKEKDDIFGFYKGKDRNRRRRWSLPHLPRKNGVTCIDSARYACRPLDGLGRPTAFQESADRPSMKRGERFEGLAISDFTFSNCAMLCRKKRIATRH